MSRTAWVGAILYPTVSISRMSDTEFRDVSPRFYNLKPWKFGPPIAPPHKTLSPTPQTYFSHFRLRNNWRLLRLCSTGDLRSSAFEAPSLGICLLRESYDRVLI